MYKVLVFAGTTEGYELCRFLSRSGVPVCACVATGYGGRLLEENKYLKVLAGRLDEEDMEGLLKQIRPELVLDATHPYAAQVTENIRRASGAVQIPYDRVLRDEGPHRGEAVYVESVEEAVEYLKSTEGNILLTTGSKELAKFMALPGYQERLFARVLSLPTVLETCRELGIEGKHLIGMQGPFSRELNEAMLRQLSCKYLVTKDSGKAGGFLEKIEAALACKVVPVIIGRPLKETGLSLGECKQMLAARFDISHAPQDSHGPHEPHVALVGIGMGSEGTLTVRGRQVIDEAELIIGAKRMVDAVRLPHHTTIYEYNSEKIVNYINNHPELDNIVIVLSGDVGFYSGAKKLLERLGEDIEVICGVSSVAYFMAKIGLSWDDARIVSAHGCECNLVSMIKRNKKVFAILGTESGVSELAQKLVYYHMEDVLLYVGENLSYENEKIFVKRASELTDYQGNALSVVCAVNEAAVPLPAVHGIADEAFQRGKAPMTKEEVRTVSLAKLRLSTDSICYDVGAGTGSVCVEMALRAHEGRVYAIEKKDEAVELLEANKRKFAVDNLEVIRGEAPAALEELPAPTHAFIGGSSGNLKEILQVLLDKNPYVKIVINCITLETVTEALQAVKDFGFTHSEIVQLSAARAKELGRYHMMMGENPIYIISCGNES
ncbi:bifunctional cobalt-precorrin-7 (C(5))-methyltransferase/cobalt-precorrin-6B (C(15))-methyltransferase [Blautia schinkii]|nr:bifunctional cobalt-precorrin-7 (C(5))-methyltransferase/cobalt-precorrin-6B (C(15))-methyltransferase [Blautia schinkii]